MVCTASCHSATRELETEAAVGTAAGTAQYPQAGGGAGAEAGLWGTGSGEQGAEAGLA